MHSLLFVAFSIFFLFITDCLAKYIDAELKRFILTCILSHRASQYISHLLLIFCVTLLKKQEL